MANRSFEWMSVVLLLLMIGGAFVVVLPLRADVVALRAQRDEVISQKQDLQAHYDELSALSTEVTQSEASKKTLLKSVPVGFAQSSLLTDLVKISQEAGFTLGNLTFSPGTNAEEGEYLMLSLSLRGSYAKLFDFLKKLENAPRLFRVISINVQRGDGDDIVFNLILNAYYQTAL